MAPADRRLAATIALAAVVAVAAGVVYYFYDPSAARFAPRCALRVLTGYDCPGCGSQRALHAALHGHWADAWHYNPFIFFAVPAAVFWLVVEYGRHRWPRLHASVTRPGIIVAVLIAILAWWIGRNL